MTLDNRTLRIKTGSVSRLTKELKMRHIELEEDRQRGEKLQIAGEDDYTIKKQNEVIQQTIDIIPHTVSRLRTARDDLQAYLESATNTTESDEMGQAKAALADSQTALSLAAS